MSDDKDGKDDDLDKLVRQALMIEVEEARQVGAVGFMARALTQATMPHRKAAGNEFVRRNGAFELTILAPSSVGLPYGSIPRLLLSWLTTEAVRTRSPVLELGPTLSAFMAELGLTRRGGNGGISHDSATRPCACSAQPCFAGTRTKHTTQAAISISLKNTLCGGTRKRRIKCRSGNLRLTLGNRFFNELIDRPVPVDMRALKALKRSPLALDIYCWLTYRLSYLRKPTEIPWPALQMQFGADYTRYQTVQGGFPATPPGR